MAFKTDLVLQINGVTYRQTIVLPFVPSHGMEILIDGHSTGFVHIIERVQLDVKNEKLTVFFAHEEYTEEDHNAVTESILASNGWVLG